MLEIDQPQPQNHPRVVVATLLVGLAVSMVLAAASDGAYHDDDLTHYLFARWAWIWPQYLLHEWGRPGFTILHFLPARLGWLACRWTSGLLSAAAAWLAYATASRLRLSLAWAVPALVFVQPLFLTLSYTTLTETALAFYLAAAVYLVVSGRPMASAAVLSLGLVTRYEAVVLIPIWVALLWRQRRRWVGLALLLWAPLVQNALAWPLLEQIPALTFLEPHGPDYGNGHWAAFLARAAVAFGAGGVCLAVPGALPVLRRPRGWVIVLSCAVYFLAHTAVRAMGSYGSGGYARFLVALSPLVAVLAGAGLGELLSWQRDRMVTAIVAFSGAMLILELGVEAALRAEGIFWLGREAWSMRLITAATALLAAATLAFSASRRIVWWRWIVPTVAGVMIGAQLAWQVRPLDLKPDQLAVRETVEWLVRSGLTGRRIVAANLWFDYFLNHPCSPTLRIFWREVARAGDGSLIAWDKRYGAQPGMGLALSELRGRPQRFRVLYRSRATRHEGVFVYVFEKLPVGSTCPPAASKL
jgi:hypothetical protein